MDGVANVTLIDQTLPFLTDADPLTSGEGSLDPLGLSPTSERLADEILPGFRARMLRPRFLTAMAVTAAVAEGIEEETASDGVTPASVVFEWLVVEAFARAGDRELYRRTPGIQKAESARQSGERMCPQAYLRTPTVFGYHGIYKPLARRLRIVDDEMRLGDNGYALLKIWAEEQRLIGFVQGREMPGIGSTFRSILRSALEESLRSGFSARKSTWSGWGTLSQHLSPGRFGRQEGRFLRQLFAREADGSTSEIFGLMEVKLGDLSEAQIVKTLLLPHASTQLRRELMAIQAFEHFAVSLEDSFAWIRYLSTKRGSTAIGPVDFSAEPSVKHIASNLPKTISRAEAAISHASTVTQQRFAELAKYYDHVDSPTTLFEAVLSHHAVVQRNKPPEGKRDWVERDSSGATIVRPQYREAEPPMKRDSWDRPYRIHTVQSFLADIRAAT